MNFNTSVLIGDTPAMAGIDEDLRDAARFDSRVLITGEHGVGKKMIASLIHQHSARNRARFLNIQLCGHA